MKKNLKGFTLVEMLIVISIIAILSGAILAGMGSSRSKARNAKVVANINTLQLIVENNYADGAYPAEGLATLTGSDKAKADAILLTGIKYCLSDKTYRIQGLLEEGKDATDLLASSLKTGVGTCACDGLNFCVGE
ncbi:MAG: type II secretion system protein [Candidatus Parcubacteria bacterium]|nr:type II secretion system protein [Candidatus Parcubacteria bacterium]